MTAAANSSMPTVSIMTVRMFVDLQMFWIDARPVLWRVMFELRRRQRQEVRQRCTGLKQSLQSTENHWPADGASLEDFAFSLKIVVPQRGLDPLAFAGLDFRYFFLQPLDGPDRAAHTQQALAYCLAHPRWRLSLQMHKVLGIP